MDTIQTAAKQDWSVKTSTETFQAFASAKEGLTKTEAAKRLQELGPNEIAQGKPTPWYVLLGRQFASPLIYILLVAALVTGLMGHYNDVIIILLVLVVNAGIGFYQERKAERAINNIKGMSAPQCRCYRDGEIQNQGKCF